MEEFKEGQRIIAVKQGIDMGQPMGSKTDREHYDYEVGWKGTVGEYVEYDGYTVTFDNGRVIIGPNVHNFELIEDDISVGDTVLIVKNNGPSGYDEYVGQTRKVVEFNEHFRRYALDGIYCASDCFALWTKDELRKVEEEAMKFKVGTKVMAWNSGDAKEFVNGKFCIPDDIVFEECKRGVAIYEVTNVDPCIIRRISDNRVFFVQQRSLKAYTPEPKFKRGDWVNYNDQYYRVSSSSTVGDKVRYSVTMSIDRYSVGAGITAFEDNIKAIQ